MYRWAFAFEHGFLQHLHVRVSYEISFKNYHEFCDDEIKNTYSHIDRYVEYTTFFENLWNVVG